MTTALRDMTPQDGPAVLAVDAEAVAGRTATFETTTPSWAGWDARHLVVPRLVAVGDDGRVLGWAALSPVSARRVYVGVGKVSVYVAEGARGRGLGRRLLERLIRRSEDAGIWTLQAGVLSDNDASVAVHESAGFHLVGVRERLGRLDDRWRDVLVFERRSTTVGT